MSKTIKVGISDLNIARSPDVLVTFSLGSCVGICLYDQTTKIAGLSHIMLPTSEQGKNDRPYCYADKALEILVQRMVAAGASRRRLTAKIAGGARMFSNFKGGNLSNIGQRNVAAVKAELGRLGIPIIADDTGKDYGRTVYFNAENGQMLVKSANRGEWVF